MMWMNLFIQELRMKRLIRKVLVLALLTFCCLSCKHDKPALVQSITLSKPSMNLLIGDSELLTATVVPSDAENGEVTWSSTNSTVASVQDGLVIALSVGITKITATAGGYSSFCDVTVTKRIIPVEEVEIDKPSLEMIEGDVENLTVTVHPDDADYNEVIWSSSDESVATVKNGEVTAISVGSAVITASAGQTIGTCNVTVNKRIIHVESLVANISQKRLKIGEEFGLELTILPDDANDYTVEYSSLNPDIASVSREGIIIGVSTGSTVVSIKADDQICNIPIKVFEKDIIFALTVDYNYSYYESKLWKNQEEQLSLRDYSFNEVYLLDSKPFIRTIKHKSSGATDYCWIVDNDIRVFNPGEGSNRNHCVATTINGRDIYSLVEYYYDYTENFSKYGVWKNNDKLYDITDWYTPGLGEYYGFKSMVFDNNQLFVVGYVTRPVSERVTATFPTIWMEGNIIKQIDVRNDRAVEGGTIQDIAIVDGEWYYLVKAGELLSVYTDTGKLYDLCPEAKSSNGQLCSYNGELYAIAVSSFSDSYERKLSAYKEGVLLYTLPNVQTASFDIVEGDLYFLVIERRLWGGHRYYSEAVYRGRNKEYTLIEETSDGLYMCPIRVIPAE